MGTRNDKRLSAFIAKLNKALWNPLTDPEEAGRIEYILKEHEAKMHSVRSSKFQNQVRGIAKGEPESALMTTTRIPISSERQVESERMLHEISSVAHQIIPDYDPSLLPAVIQKPQNFFPYRKYDFVGKDKTKFDTNWAYNESPDMPPDWAMNLPVTQEQAEEFRRIDERKNRLTSIAQKRHASRLAREASANLAYRYDTMDEFDQKMSDLTKRYGGDTARADTVMRTLLKKELPSFFKNSKLSTKSLSVLAKSYKGIQSASPMLAGIISNPISALAGGYLAAAKWWYSNSDKANESVVDWSNATNLYGLGSDQFSIAAYRAGLKGPGEISRTLGKHAIKYGGAKNAEMLLTQFGSMLSSVDPDQKIYIAQALGLDERDVAIAEMLSGGLKPSEARRVAGNKAMIEAQKTAGWASGSGVLNTAQSAYLSIPGIVSAQARDIEAMGTEKYLTESYKDALRDISVQVNVGEVKADNPEDLAEKTIGEGSEAFRAVIESMDQRVQ